MTIAARSPRSGDSKAPFEASVLCDAKGVEVRLRGILDSTGEEVFHRILDPLQTVPSLSAVLRTEELESLDDAGLRCLAAFASSVTAHGGEVTID